MIQILAIVLASAVMITTETQAAPERPGHLDDDYVLVYHDEFDGQQLDESRWTWWALGTRRDAINTKQAIGFDGEGRLTITTYASTADDGATTYHTGGIWSSGLFEPRFGYFECRMTLPSELGYWNAFWLNAPGMGRPPGDPRNAGVEMDIMESHVRMKPGTVQHNIHWDGYGKDHKARGATPRLGESADGFRTFGMLWAPGGYTFYIDGKQSWQWLRDDGAPVSHRPEHIIVSCEVGTWAGAIQQANLPDDVLVDYVRVWQPMNAHTAKRHDRAEASIVVPVESPGADLGFDLRQRLETAEDIERVAAVLAANPNATVHIDVRSDDMEIIRAMLAEHDAFERIVCSFESDDAVAAWRDAQPSGSLAMDLGDRATLAERIERWRPTHVRVRGGDIDEALVRRIHEHEMKIIVVVDDDDVAAMRSGLDCGVDVVVTDQPLTFIGIEHAYLRSSR
jgi:beta-glucanase (GH16 family)